MTTSIVESVAFAREYSNVEDALVVQDASSVTWDEEADFVVVGYGGAGVAAANQALDGGLSVIALDRFVGGGATAMNGGVIYTGGGTWVQKEAGYDDTPEAMFEYLSKELQGIVTEETLRDFCEQGPEMLGWLEAHGVRFEPVAYPHKTSYPTRRYHLYFPDNSLLRKYRGQHKPAPRGHKVKIDIGKANEGFGRGIFEPQRDAAAAAGLRLFSQTTARQLVLDKDGALLGVKAYRVPPGTPQHAELVKAQRLMQKWLSMLPSTTPGVQIPTAIGRYYNRKAARIEAAEARPVYIRARRGVTLSAGGFIFNKQMVREFAPRFTRVFPLGTLADDGSGILLGRSAGGALNRMDEVSGWRFLNPPKSWGKGALVNARGARYVDEASYGATIGRAMMRTGNDGVAWLILDAELWEESKNGLKHEELWPFQRDPARATMTLRTKKAPTLEALARKLGFDESTFLETIANYRKAQAGEIEDPFEKAPEDMGRMARGPYRAIDLGVTSPFFPLPSITVGGLLVDERSGLVLREDGSTIPGLYAAGRTAVGLCSNIYLSGLSAADCIFSGRRAGRHASNLTDVDRKSVVGLCAAGTN